MEAFVLERRLTMKRTKVKLCVFGNVVFETGLHIAIVLLEKVKLMFPEISYADIYQMASATAIQVIFGSVTDT